MCAHSLNGLRGPMVVVASPDYSPTCLPWRPRCLDGHLSHSSKGVASLYPGVPTGRPAWSGTVFAGPTDITAPTRPPDGDGESPRHRGGTTRATTPVRRRLQTS